MKNVIFSSKYLQKVFGGKNDIFHDFSKVVLHIIEGHPRYVEVSWGSREAISSNKSRF